jgi:hypothetical protein
LTFVPVLVKMQVHIIRRLHPNEYCHGVCLSDTVHAGITRHWSASTSADYSIDRARAGD